MSSKVYQGFLGAAGVCRGIDEDLGDKRSRQDVEKREYGC
jgi:hypothetical protein